MNKRDRRWRPDWSVSAQTRIERRAAVLLDERSAELLRALDQARSVTVAARALGISYRHAWLIIQDANAAAGEALTSAAVGGRQGGGTRLTDAGRFVLNVWDELQSAVRRSAGSTLRRMLRAASRETDALHVFAAISLQEVVAGVLAEFSLARPMMSVRSVFGASNELAEQILSGSTVDLFLSAGSGPIDRLAEASVIDRRSRCTIAKNGLAAVATKDVRFGGRSASGLLKSGSTALVVADPACPLGSCTRDYLKAAGVYDQLRSRLMTVDNSRAVVSALRDRRRAVGIIFGSDLGKAPALRTLFRVPVTEAGSSYEGVILRHTELPNEAADLLGFFSSQHARSCLRRGGFTT